MFLKFIFALKQRSIDYIILNGYEDIIEKTNDSDIDILLRRKDFLSVDEFLKEICKNEGWSIIQIFHHDTYAKNIFLFNLHSQEILNLDIYGFLSRMNVPLFTEERIFQNALLFKGYYILSKEHEFVYYLIKKLDKKQLTNEKFDYLNNIFKSNREKCSALIKEYFPNTYFLIEKSLQKSDINLLLRKQIIDDFSKRSVFGLEYYVSNIFRLLKRIDKPTGLVIAFLGSDGTGKSTIIDLLKSSNLPFRKFQYYHLKPINPKQINNTVSNPHEKPPYNLLKSYCKLLYLVFQYNLGWIKNILISKIKSTLIVFDRYYDDLLVDPKRFRYGGNILIAKWARHLIPKPDLIFVLTASPQIIYSRKQELDIIELSQQVKIYNSFENKNNYHLLDVSDAPTEITSETIRIIVKKMGSRYI